MKIHQLSVEQAIALNSEFLEYLVSQGVTKMNDEQKAITLALDAFEAMHFWIDLDPERAKLYACEFELLRPSLESWFNEHGRVYLET